MAVARQHGVNADIGYGVVGQDFFQGARGKCIGGDEGGLASDAQTVDGGLEQDIAVIGLDAAMNRDAFRLAMTVNDQDALAERV